MKAWASISLSMGISIELCTKRWATLREKYVKIKRKLELSSGSGAAKLDTWPLYQAMRFLDPYVVVKPTRSSENICQIMPVLPPSPTPLPLPSTSYVLPPSPTLFLLPSPSYVLPPSPTLFPLPSPSYVLPPSPTPLPLPSPSSVLPPSPTPLPLPSPSSVLPPSPTPSPLLSSSPVPSLMPSPPVPKPKTTRKRCHEVQNAILDAVNAYKSTCESRRESRLQTNATIRSFAEMIGNIVVDLNCPHKQSVAMQRLMTLAIQIKVENESAGQVNSQ